MKRGEDDGKKMPFCEQYNLVAYPASFVSHASSSNVSTAHHSALTNMAESYYSYSSLRKPERLVFEASSDRKPRIIPKYESMEDNPEYRVSERGARKRCASEAEISSHVYPRPVTCSKPAKIETMNQSKSAQETSDIFKEDEEDSRSITPDDIVKVFGQKLFEKARKTILDQQRIFSFQILELHRLIKVQKLIARSPEKNQQFTPIDNKLLHVFPPPVPKPKTDPLNLKLSPWLFHPPIGNQWLVPVKSPSEGLIYKPTSGITLGVPATSSLTTDQEDEPLEKEGLSLFPTTPSSELLKEENEDGKVQVIKVIPHNRKSASESAARIFRSLQEERRIRRISSCGSHVS